MIEAISAKQIIQPVKFDNSKWFGIDYNMNLYHGCSHGCIYCDSRSEIYHIKNFDCVRYKENAIEILCHELCTKRKKGVIGIGAMSDTYNPFEKQLCITREALKLIERYQFGVSIDTKSPLVLRDIPILKGIGEYNSAIVKVTITTSNDELSKKIEPNVAASSERFKTVKKLNEAGIFCGILLTPMLPFLTDNEAEIRSIIKQAHLAGAKFIFTLYGMTMRDGQREYFYHNLKKFAPELVEKYRWAYGANYICDSPYKSACEKILKEECERYDILTEMSDIIAAYKKTDNYVQLRLF